MRVLFMESNSRFIFGLPLGFRDLGHQILVSGSVEADKLLRIFNFFKPDLAVVLGWSKEHEVDKLDLMRAVLDLYEVPLIYWATEDPTFLDYFSLPLVTRLSPIQVFTVSEKAIPTYEALGYKASYLPFAYQPSLFYPTRNSSKKQTLGLVANAYPNVLSFDITHYRKASMNILIKPLLENGIPIQIWGEGWNEIEPFLGHWVSPDLLHGPVHYLQTNKLYNDCEMLLGLQNEKEDVISMRTFEILGSGGLLLTSYHTKIEELFTINKDLVMASSALELLEYYHFYYKNPSARIRLRKNGTKAVAAHSYKIRASEILSQLRKEGYLL